MVRIGILGATGYTALELIKILLRHAEAKITVVTSRQEGSPHISGVHPQLTKLLDLRFQNVEPLAVAAQTDCVFSCLPHAASAASLRPLLDSGTRIIDLSADFRLWDAATYEEWYGERHPVPEYLGKAAYGLPELFRESIRAARVVANPGCYPTSAILGLAPLLKEQLIDPSDVIVDAKSGVSGAGRNPKLTTHYPECNESISAYNVGRHRHTPEIQQILSHVADEAVGLIFTPHLTPMDRGILATSYCRLLQSTTEDTLMEVLRDFYAAEPFVRVVDHLPGTKDTTGTNFCDITARVVGDRVIVVSCIDNLIKGASGAAVQNFNLMFGFPEVTGL